MLAGVAAGLQVNHSVHEVGIEPTISAMSTQHSSAELLVQADEQRVHLGTRKPPFGSGSPERSGLGPDLVTDLRRLVEKISEQGLYVGGFSMVTHALRLAKNNGEQVVARGYVFDGNPRTPAHLKRQAFASPIGIWKDRPLPSSSWS